jgi:hypothetical protein
MPYEGGLLCVAVNRSGVSRTMLATEAVPRSRWSSVSDSVAE